MQPQTIFTVGLVIMSEIIMVTCKGKEGGHLNA